MTLKSIDKQSIAKRAGKVAVLYGGLSAEREVSLNSGAQVLSALKNAGVDAVGIDANRDVLNQLSTVNPDYVFIALHGAGGEDGSLQGALQFAGYRYTGSGVTASAVGMDKQLSKQVWKAVNLPVAESITLRSDTDWDAAIAGLGGQAVVKPVHEGSSIGMSIVHSAAELKRGFEEAANYDRTVMAERFISGPEFTVAILDDQALPVIKLETDNEFYDYEAKYLSDQTRYLCPCGLAPEEEEKIQTLALQAFNALGCRGWGRVDIMQDSDGEFYILEVNTVPGMTDHSLVPMAARAAGYDFESLVLVILSQVFPREAG